MKRTLIAVALLVSSAVGLQAQGKAATKSDAPPIEAKVRTLWDAFQKKDKATLSALLADGFRQFEEGLSTFGDKQAEVNAVDEYELIRYTLSDFSVKPLPPNSALVTYIAQYEGKSGGENLKAKSVFGEVWTRTGSEWKCLYMQETYVK